MKERQVLTLPGVPMVLILLVLMALCGWWLWHSVTAFVSPVPPLVAGTLVGFCGMGFFIVQPNQAAVMQFFGKYVGSERTSGLRWANPFYTKKTVTLRVRNF
jgi:hypothetical protein